MRVGDEVTISYGARSNGTLLLRFGFAVFDSTDETVPLPGCADGWVAMARLGARRRCSRRAAPRRARRAWTATARRTPTCSGRCACSSRRTRTTSASAAPRGSATPSPPAWTGGTSGSARSWRRRRALRSRARARWTSRAAPRTRRGRDAARGGARRAARGGGGVRSDAAARTTRATRRTKARWTTGVWALQWSLGASRELDASDPRSGEQLSCGTRVFSAGLTRGGRHELPAAACFRAGVPRGARAHISESRGAVLAAARGVHAERRRSVRGDHGGGGLRREGGVTDDRRARGSDAR